MNSTGDPYRGRTRPTIGWDLGGIHIKAALVDESGIEAVAQVPCLLWQGVEALDASLQALPAWAREEACHAVTMTGELCDAFSSRHEGVAELVRWATHRLNGPVRIYAGRVGFMAPEPSLRAAPDVASANWHATARLVGRRCGDALLVDVGSTTADLIPVIAGNPRAQGYSDAERLRTGELVYTGAVRTPLMALGPRVPFRGHWVGLMAEHFATTADIHRLLGTLDGDADQQEAADGRGKSIPETETRLARMIGCDRADATPAEWRELAAAFADAQLARLVEAARQVLSASPLPGDAPLVGCGAGRFIAERLAGRLARPYRDLNDILAPGLDNAWISTCAPAVAVALLSLSE